MENPMTNEQIEAVARVRDRLANASINERAYERPMNWEDAELLIAAIAAMPDRFAEGYAAAKAQAVQWADQHYDLAECDHGVTICGGKRCPNEFCGRQEMADLVSAIASMEPGA